MVPLYDARCSAGHGSWNEGCRVLTVGHQERFVFAHSGLLDYDEVPLEVNAKLGAGEAHLDLGSLNLRGVTMDIGVGEVSVDLRGTPKTSYEVRVNGGVGEARITLPRTVGISANAKGGIGEIHVDGLEKRGERWVNPGHENDAVQITVDAKGGVGEIRIVAQ